MKVSVSFLGIINNFPYKNLLSSNNITLKKIYQVSIFNYVILREIYAIDFHVCFLQDNQLAVSLHRTMLQIGKTVGSVLNTILLTQFPTQLISYHLIKQLTTKVRTISTFHEKCKRNILH